MQSYLEKNARVLRHTQLTVDVAFIHILRVTVLKPRDEILQNILFSVADTTEWLELGIGRDRLQNKPSLDFAISRKFARAYCANIT